MKVKTILILVLFLAATVIVAPDAFSQRPFRPHKPPMFNIEMLADELGLTEEQLAKIKDQRFTTEKNSIEARSKIDLAELELRQLLDAEKPDENRIKNKIDEIGKLKADLRWTRVQERLKIKSLLTPEQQEKLEDIKKERMKERMHRGRPFQHGRSCGDFEDD